MPIMETNEWPCEISGRESPKVMKPNVVPHVNRSLVNLDLAGSTWVLAVQAFGDAQGNRLTNMMATVSLIRLAVE